TCSTTYSSTDPTVASVDENSGKITANKTGKTTVSCTTANGVTVRCLVYVTSSALTKMKKA
ncbi:MAG: Ig-like domain-containing protein, partial [Ruminococcus bromii]